MDNKDPLKNLQEIYKNDKFATNAGCVIVEATKEKVICQMPICDSLSNARGGVMGGAIFTLADFCFAVLSNLSGYPSVAIECNIRFFSQPKGKMLFATCTPDKEGRTLGHYSVEICDETGRKVAGYTAIAFHTDK